MQQNRGFKNCLAFPACVTCTSKHKSESMGERHNKYKYMPIGVSRHKFFIIALFISLMSQ